MMGSMDRGRAALRSEDFRRLFAMRLVSTLGDGLLQAALVASIVFDPERQDTITGFAIASAIVVLPYSALGPFVGVFIDRWSRRRILVLSPLLRAAAVGLVLFDPIAAPLPFYAGALWVLSVNRLFLATATASTPRLVPTEDLLVANSLSTVGGTTALLAGVFAGGLVSDAAGTLPVVVTAAATWVGASALARRIRDTLVPHRGVASAPARSLRGDLSGAIRELDDGARHLMRTPRALAPILSMSIDQMGQGIVLVLSLFVFRERFDQGVGSFSTLIGAGAVGVLVGLLSVGKLEERLSKERIVALGFVLGGAALIAVATHVTGWTVLVASAVVGLAFAWKKVPADTMVQEAVPDRYRGRVFAVYDGAYQCFRLLATVLAIPMLPALGVAGSVATVGAVFLFWSPVLPWWLRGVPEIVVLFHEGARAEEWPRAVVWGGVEESVDVVWSRLEEIAGVRSRRYRLALEDGTTLEVSRPEGEDSWHLDRELDLPAPRGPPARPPRRQWRRPRRSLSRNAPPGVRPPIP
jgi:MFS family permease